AGLIRTVLCLHGGYLPGTTGWQRPDPEFTAGFADSALYVPDTSRPWLRDSRRARRYAAVSMVGAQGGCAHLVLSADGTRGRVVDGDWQRARGPVLLALSAPDLDGLLASVERHRGLLDDGADPWALARAAARELPGAPLRAVLVGRDP
ncbi:hypothetical protein GTW59_22655, partial [Streptomyces sp. SID89]|nr:hypothetical protein [Streptomyces sp. SID89]